ncbi:MAG TPA: response regulator [Candidatus Limnocylindria bacterium]|nr:response regulator [Candidatus Limnocylindria bacterium]
MEDRKEGMAGEKILCVDDDDSIRKLCTVYLAKRGYRVEAVANGLEALELIASKGPPDVVVTDVNMPLMNGLELVKRLRADRRTARTPIIVLSAAKQEQDILAGYSQGADDYVGKPIDLAVLAAKIETILRQTRSVTGVVAAPRKLGVVMAFAHGKGGVGATTLAANVAVALAADGKAVVLVDLNLQFGTAAMFFDLRPRTTIVEFARGDVSRITEDDFGQYLADHNSGVRVLAAPPSPEEAELVSVGAVQQAIDLARGGRDAVLLDLAAKLDEVTLAALDVTDMVCVVTAPHLASLRSTSDALAMLTRIGIADERILIALVRNTAKGIDDAGVAKFLKRKPDIVVPFAEKADAAADLGVPYVLAEPNDKTTAALKQLAVRLATRKAVPA